MKPTPRFLIAFAVVLVLVAEPAMAQSIDLSPIQDLLQGIVDALTGPLGVVIATLAVLGIFLILQLHIASDFPVGGGGDLVCPSPARPSGKVSASTTWS